MKQRTFEVMSIISTTPSNNDLEEAHRLFVPDLDLVDFAESYREVASVHPGARARYALTVSKLHSL